jgi:hypothetical protein
MRAADFQDSLRYITDMFCTLCTLYSRTDQSVTVALFFLLKGKRGNFLKGNVNASMFSTFCIFCVSKDFLPLCNSLECSF